MNKKPSRIFFISSTIYDLQKERNFVRKIFKQYKTKYVSMDCMMSEFPDFPLSLEQIKSRSYDICLQNVAVADFFMIILKKRYGCPIIKYGNDTVSIMHKEYLKAYELKKPIFAFIDHRTWNGLNRYNNNKVQKWVSNKQIRIFDLINLIRKRKRNWITIYKSLDDIRCRLVSSLFKYDYSVFVGDMTVPDGETIKCGTRFTKIWEIENAGFVPWVDRKLIEINSGASGLVPHKNEISLPRTNPGERVKIRINFKAPYDEATCISKWKMVDKFGQYTFPRLGGIWCKIKAVHNIEVI